MSVGIGRLNPAFGSSRSASSAYQKWPTRRLAFHATAPSQRAGLLTHLKFENRAGETGRWCAPLRVPHPRGGAGGDPTSAGARRPSLSLRHGVSLGGPLTRARVRLLGPCFKTGRVGCRHRRRPLAPVRGPVPARRRDAVGGGRGWEGVAGKARQRSSPSAPGEAARSWQRGCNARRRSDEPPSPRTLPSRPRAGRGAPPRRKCARRGTGPAGGRSREGIRTAPARPTWPAELNPPGGLRGPHPFTSQRFHALLNSLFKVLFNFPLRYLSTIGLVPVFSLRWSLPPALGCIPKQPDSEKTAPLRDGGRYRPHTIHGLSLDQKDSGPRSSPGEAVFRTPHFPRPPDGRGFGAGLFPLHSPLLRESWAGRKRGVRRGPEPPSRRSETDARPRRGQRGWRNHRQPRSSSGERGLVLGGRRVRGRPEEGRGPVSGAAFFPCDGPKRGPPNPPGGGKGSSRSMAKRPSDRRSPGKNPGPQGRPGAVKAPFPPRDATRASVRGVGGALFQSLNRRPRPETVDWAQVPGRARRRRPPPLRGGNRCRKGEGGRAPGLPRRLRAGVGPVLRKKPNPGAPLRRRPGDRAAVGGLGGRKAVASHPFPPPTSGLRSRAGPPPAQERGPVERCLGRVGQGRGGGAARASLPSLRPAGLWSGRFGRFTGRLGLLGLSGGKGGGRRPSARPARNRPGGQEPLAHKPGGPAREGPGRAGWDIQSVRVARGVCHGAQNLGYSARFWGDFQLVRAARIVCPWSSKLGYVAKGTHRRSSKTSLLHIRLHLFEYPAPRPIARNATKIPFCGPRVTFRAGTTVGHTAPEHLRAVAWAQERTTGSCLGSLEPGDSPECGDPTRNSGKRTLQRRRVRNLRVPRVPGAKN
ncbi:hypothetical protein SKAU_G00212780 [Synaphobranchus kaupii]|uniref:Uncharacterized protein n=1 Tax=Synaphobranchus kaupii TaxID=118154 RepID=A0A9Q1F976_SYNKA|nr:hypothetical protein SKAU_G00212780 [Synaphobranchus kaupii]